MNSNLTPEGANIAYSVVRAYYGRPSRQRSTELRHGSYMAKNYEALHTL